MHHGPSVCCPEFKPRNRKTDPNKLYERFCLKCANFENVEGIPICAKDHRPGIACGAFRARVTRVSGLQCSSAKVEAVSFG
jgi:hypothetical protein